MLYDTSTSSASVVAKAAIRRFREWVNGYTHDLQPVISALLPQIAPMSDAPLAPLD